MAQAGRNEACPCGSGKKYKQCCAIKQQRMSMAMRLVLVAVGGIILAGVVLGYRSFTAERTPGTGQVWSEEHGHYH
jgi:SEC-C motif